MQDEILIKGKDGKWYVLKGDDLLPYGNDELGIEKQKSGVLDLPKGKKPLGPVVFSVAPSSPALPKPPLQIPPPAVMHEGHPLRVELEELAVQVLQDSKLDFSDPVLRKRFLSIVSARLRDIRDALETKAMLERPVKIGGMGLVPPLNPPLIKGGSGGVDQIMGIIEKAFQSFQAKWKDVEKKRIEEWKKKQKAEKEERERQAVKKEQEEMEGRYNRLTGKIPNSQFPIPKEVSKPKIQISKIPVEPKVVNRGQAAGVAVAPKIEKKIPPPPVRPPPSVLRPLSKITDVRRVPRLIGPVDEIASLTLSDFRRLAPTAKEAVLKIASKVEFLSKESLERRTQAISAWQRSPLNQFYVFITRQALISRTPPQTLLAELGQQGKPTLTTEEFYAIMELNQKLRF